MHCNFPHYIIFYLSPVIIPNIFAVSLVAIYFVGVEHVYNWFTIMELATLIALAGTFLLFWKLLCFGSDAHVNSSCILTQGISFIKTNNGWRWNFECFECHYLYNSKLFCNTCLGEDPNSFRVATNPKQPINLKSCVLQFPILIPII